DGFLAACRLTHDLCVRYGFEERAQSGAEEWVVVGDQEADRLAQPASCSGAKRGNRAATFVPTPGVDLIWQLPASSAARSCLLRRPAPVPRWRIPRPASA